MVGCHGWHCWLDGWLEWLVGICSRPAVPASRDLQASPMTCTLHLPLAPAPAPGPALHPCPCPCTPGGGVEGCGGLSPSPAAAGWQLRGARRDRNPHTTTKVQIIVQIIPMQAVVQAVALCFYRDVKYDCWFDAGNTYF